MSCGVAHYHHHQRIVDGTDKPTHGTDEAVDQAAQQSTHSTAQISLPGDVRQLCAADSCLHVTAPCTCNSLQQTLYLADRWAARYNTWLLIKLTPKGVVFSFLCLT